MRLATLVGGTLYAVGLLIVNINLARYGLLLTEIARAQYILAGAGWAAFIFIPAALGYEAGTRTKYWLILYLCLQLSLPITESLLIMSGALVRWGPYYSRYAALTFYFGLSAFVADLRRGENSLFRALFGAQLRIDMFSTPGLYAVAFVYSLGLVWVYATYVFPIVPASFGGGETPLIQIALRSDARIPWGSLGIPIPDDCEVVGALRLILKTDSSVVVSSNSPLLAPYTMRGLGRLPAYLTQGLKPSRPPTIEVDQDLILAMQYIGSSDAPTSCLKQASNKAAGSSEPAASKAKSGSGTSEKLLPSK